MTDGTARHAVPRPMRGAVDQADPAPFKRLLDVSGRKAGSAAHTTYPGRAPAARRKPSARSVRPASEGTR
jgi:hypothetical protein